MQARARRMYIGESVCLGAKTRQGLDRMAGSVAQPVRSIIAPSKLRQIGSWTFPIGNQHNPRPRIRAVRVRRSGQ
jgi:hypothetical protein